MNTKKDVEHRRVALELSAIREALGEHVQFIYRSYPDGCPSHRFNCLLGVLIDEFSEIEKLNVNVIIWGLPDAWFDYAQRCENETGRHYRDYIMPRSFASLEEWIVRKELHTETPKTPDINGLKDYLFHYAGLLVSVPNVDWLLICDTGVCALDATNNRPVVVMWDECDQLHRDGEFLIFHGNGNNLRIRLPPNQFVDGVRLKIMCGIKRLSSL